MAKMSKIDKERRFARINKLIKKYHTKERTLPQVYEMVRAEVGVSQSTIRNAINSGL